MPFRTSTIVAIAASAVLALSCGGESRPPGSPPPGSPSNQPPANAISILPSTVQTGSPDIVLVVTGSDFGGGIHHLSSVIWSAAGTDNTLVTTFINSTQLTALVPAALLTFQEMATVFVQTSDATGDGAPPSKSNSVNFYVTDSAGPPAITSISPAGAAVGSSDLTITIEGANFQLGQNLHYWPSDALWSSNGQNTTLQVTHIDSTKMTAVIPATLLSNATTAKISIQSWFFADDTPKWTSNAVSFAVAP